MDNSVRLDRGHRKKNSLGNLQLLEKSKQTQSFGPGLWLGPYKAGPSGGVAQRWMIIAYFKEEPNKSRCNIHDIIGQRRHSKSNPQ